MICLLLVVGPLVTLGVRVSYQVEHYYLDEMRQALQSHARLAVEVIAEESLHSQPLNLPLLCTQLSDKIGAEISVVTAAGKKIADSHTPHIAPLDHPSLEAKRMNEGCALCHAEVDDKGQVTASAKIRSAPYMGDRVVVSMSSFGAKRVVSKVQRMVLGTTVLAVLFSTLLTLRLAGGVADPIVRMSRMAEVIAEGDFNQRLDARRGDEVGRLAESLNRMATRIQGMVSRLVDERNARRKFVEDVSHNFRTPVTALRTSVDALLNGAAEEPEVRNEFLTALDNQSAKLCSLVGELLDMSAVEASESIEERACVPFLDVLQRVLNELKPGIEKKNLKVIVDVDSEVRVWGDPRQIEILLANLLDNAIKYNQMRGTIVAEARQNLDCVIATIADSGMGIQSHEIDHIFDRFFRSKPARSGEIPGTGLGLAIAKDIVEAHGGHIHAESTPGKGSAFTITLPACTGNRSRLGNEAQPPRVTEKASGEPFP